MHDERALIINGLAQRIEDISRNPEYPMVGALKEYLGWIGFMLVLLCWIPQTIKCLRKEEIRLSKTFLALTALGSITLFLHALCMNDLPFVVLNVYAALNAGVNLYFLSARPAAVLETEPACLEQSSERPPR